MIQKISIYRTLLHDWIEEDELVSSQTVMTYYGCKTTRPSEILEPGMIAPTPITHFGIPCHFHDVVTRAGIIPPVSVYQQTAYSIVAETNAQYNQVFFKKIYIRAVFVFSGGVSTFGKLFRLCRHLTILKLYLMRSSWSYVTPLRNQMV
jgi:hypothetical protein